MTEEMPEQFDSFITPEGELIPIEDVDAMLSVLTRRMEDQDMIIRALRDIAGICSESGRIDAACAYLEKVLSLLDFAGEKAACLLRMGLIHEMSGDFRAAIAAYARAFELPQEKSETWYFLNNNLAYCLNQEHMHDRAENHCRAAIKINRKCHNAHKNLGMALQGQGRFAAAARSYLRAAKLCPMDSRALGLLKSLLASHGEILDRHPEFLTQLHDRLEADHVVTGRYRIQ